MRLIEIIQLNTGLKLIIYNLPIKNNCTNRLFRIEKYPNDFLFQLLSLIYARINCIVIM